MELQFKVDSELCIGCGECVQDCPMSCLQPRLVRMQRRRAAGLFCCGASEVWVSTSKAVRFAPFFRHRNAIWLFLTGGFC